MEEIYELKKQGMTWRDIQGRLKRKISISALSVALKRFCQENDLEPINSRNNAGRKKATYSLEDKHQYLPNDTNLSLNANDSIQAAAGIYKGLFQELDAFEEAVLLKYNDNMAQVEFSQEHNLEKEARDVIDAFNNLKTRLK